MKTELPSSLSIALNDNSGNVTLFNDMSATFPADFLKALDPPSKLESPDAQGNSSFDQIASAWSDQQSASTKPSFHNALARAFSLSHFSRKEATAMASLVALEEVLVVLRSS